MHREYLKEYNPMIVIRQIKNDLKQHFISCLLKQNVYMAVTLYDAFYAYYLRPMKDVSFYERQRSGGVSPDPTD